MQLIELHKYYRHYLRLLEVYFYRNMYKIFQNIRRYNDVRC